MLALLTAFAVITLIVLIFRVSFFIYCFNKVAGRLLKEAKEAQKTATATSPNGDAIETTYQEV